MLAGNACVVLILFGSALGNVYTRMWIVSPVLGVDGDLCNIGAIDTASQAIPEGKLDEATEAVHRVFIETRFVEDNGLAAVVFGEGELLEQIGEHVCAADIVLFESIGAQSTER